MIKQAHVIAVENGSAIIRVCLERQECAGCQSCSAGQKTPKDSKELVLALQVDEGVRVGDNLEIDLALPDQLLAAILVFVPPMLGMIIGAAGARLLYPASGSAVVIGSIAGFLAGFGLTGLFERMISRRPLRATLRRVLPPNPQ
ncbi:SoxR reducing system RseC family protein [Thermodesulfobacteriota bacterium]